MGFALPFYLYSQARSTGFTLEYAFFRGLAQLVPGSPFRPARELSLERLLALRDDLNTLLRRDAENIAGGVYPSAVLAPEAPWKHMTRLPRIFADGMKIYWRRKRGDTAEFSAQARELAEELPLYYRRNFHFQTSGYLSHESAEVYEHQVEMLFAGAADAMRRMIIPPLRRAFAQPGKQAFDGRGLRLLEVAAGTGRATRFVSLAFPRAQITATDLSDPYLKLAQRKLAQRARINFLQADGAKLPFRDGEFDAAYSVFLFHELPLEAREAVLRESIRVLKPGGYLGLVDSLQLGDNSLFDPLLEDFPKDFHEPFYRNYVAHPMEALLTELGLEVLERSTGFGSKMVWARKV